MKKKINLNGAVVDYRLLKKRGIKNLRITLRSDGILVSAPKWCPNYEIEKFLALKAEWIIKHVKDFYEREIPNRINLRDVKKNYLKHREKARLIITQKARVYAEVYGLDYRRVFIRDQKTLWGSCSRGRNLNFNYRLIFLPERLMDYVIVHEICHLRELNHSPKFWNLVAQTFPDYKKIRKELKKII